MSNFMRYLSGFAILTVVVLAAPKADRDFTLDDCSEDLKLQFRQMTSHVRPCIDAANAFIRYDEHPARFPESANPCFVDPNDDDKDPEGLAAWCVPYCRCTAIGLHALNVARHQPIPEVLPTPTDDE